MKKERITEAILRELGEAGDAYLEEAEPKCLRLEVDASDPHGSDAEKAKEVSSGKSGRRIRRPALGVIYRWGAVAACLLLIVGGVLLGYRYRRAVSNGGLSETDMDQTDIPSDFAEMSEPGTSGNDMEGEGNPAASESGAPGENDPGLSGNETPGEDTKLYADDGLPRIPLTELQSGGMGFEGYLYHSLEELKDCLKANPWREDCGITTLPVYRNGSYDPSGAGVPLGLSEEEMQERLDRAAGSLGVEVKETVREHDPLYKDDGTKEDVLTRLVASLDREGWELTSYADGEIRFDFRLDAEEEPSLPDACLRSSSEISREEVEEITDFLVQRFSGLLNFQEPVQTIYSDRDIYHEMQYSSGAYEGAGSLEEQILNAAFRSAAISLSSDTFTENPSEVSGLFWIRDWLITAEKLGDYPLITPEEAEEKLLEGKYLTSVPYELPGKDSVSAVELVYRSGPLEEYFLPYYRFYVDITACEPETQVSDSELQENGLQRCEEPLILYGAYYVPALPEKYLMNLTVYDGHFN